MKKRAVCVGFAFAFAILVLGAVASAANDTAIVDNSKKIDNAFKCLEKEISAKDSFSLQEAVFGTLALVSDKKLEKTIEDEKKSGDACWPKNGCNIKETAQVMLAYDRAGKSTKEIKEWLLKKSFSVKDLVWYLEIDTDSHTASECTIKYESHSSKISIKDDMTLAGSSGCFEIAYGGYWLKIKESCLDKEFEISCDDGSSGNFVTTLAYQRKAGDSTVYVSSETHSSAKGGTTTEKVSSKCFGTSKCDYEGTLWAALAFEYIGENTRDYIPYLSTLAEDNQKYLPPAFLTYLTGSEQEYAKLIEKQKTAGYWNAVSSPYSKFYDTALALFVLGDREESNAAKEYLLGAQTKEGCWNNNNIKDTGFVLFGGWAKEGRKSDPGKLYCTQSNYYCEAKLDCLGNSGNVIEGYLCDGPKICCSKKVVLPSCKEKGGIICSSGQDCTDNKLEPSSDGQCCMGGACVVPPEIKNPCEDVRGGECKVSCDNDESPVSESCPDSADVCCVEGGGSPPTEESSYLIWIIILGILIILVVLGIINRHKIQMWWMSRKKSGRGGAPAGPPGRGMRPGPFGPGPGMMRQMPLRYGPPGQRGPVMAGPAPRVTRGAKSPQDKEMEETMRKLKEMSK